jgi:hypothetical protein
MAMRRKNSGLYPKSEEVLLTDELAEALDEMATAKNVSKCEVMRISLQKLAIAYRRSGVDALRGPAAPRRRYRKPTAQLPQLPAEATGTD